MASLAFIGDSHLGYRHRSKVKRLHDYSRAFEEAVNKLLELKPDVVVFAGDLLHHPRPDPVSLRTVLQKLIIAANLCPVIVCIGNHEIEGHLGTTYSPIYGDIHDNIHVLSSENNQVNIKLGGKTYCFHGFEYTRSRELAEDKLRKMMPSTDAEVNILCLHQAVEKYLSPHEISLAALRQAAPSYNLIVLGHVHKHQQIKEVFDVTPAFYCGSTERTSFNEAQNVNGFLFFEDDDFRNPKYVQVASADMTYIREEFTGCADELNNHLVEVIKSNPAPLLKLEVSADLQDDYLDVRRDWSAFQDERTILEVNVIPNSIETDIHLERMELNEDTLIEYFKKSQNNNKELEDLCIELFRRYAV